MSEATIKIELEITLDALENDLSMAVRRDLVNAIVDRLFDQMPSLLSLPSNIELEGFMINAFGGHDPKTGQLAMRSSGVDPTKREPPARSKKDLDS